MHPATVTLAISAFLSGAVTAIFVMLVASIHTDDRRHRLTATPDRQIEALTRTMLGVGVRTGPLGSGTDSEKN
jgi:ABC-type enterobactin transport system permease subunit